MTDRPVNLRLDEQLCFALYAALGSVTRSYRPLLAQIGLTVHPRLGAVRGQLHRGPVAGLNDPDIGAARGMSPAP